MSKIIDSIVWTLARWHYRLTHRRHAGDTTEENMLADDGYEYDFPDREFEVTIPDMDYEWEGE